MEIHDYKANDLLAFLSTQKNKIEIHDYKANDLLATYIVKRLEALRTSDPKKYDDAVTPFATYIVKRLEALRTSDPKKYDDAVKEIFGVPIYLG